MNLSQFLTWLFLLGVIKCLDIPSTWENIDYTRTIDLSKSFVKETILLEVKNIGKLPNNEYFFHIPDGLNTCNILLISVSLEDNQIYLNAKEITNKLYQLRLPIPIGQNSNVVFKIRYVYLNNISPVPSELELDQSQILLLKLNKFNYNAYPTKSYQLIVQGVTKGQEIEILNNNYEQEVDRINLDVPEVKPIVEDQILKVGPVFDIAPYSVKSTGLIYEHNRPLAQAENLERSIWLPSSDIDKFQIEEYYELTNKGASLKLGFLRLDWLKGRYETMRNHWAFSHFELPIIGDNDFENYYFSDKVGMVSTHKIVQNFLLFQPRFPIFGGWFYNFTLSWDQHFNNHLRKLDSDTYILKVPLINSGVDLTYKNVNLNFYLPENSEFVNISSPIKFNSIDTSNELSYLDVSKGHNKITVNYSNLFEDLNNIDVLVIYKFTKINYWWKVLKISSFVFIGLMSYYLLNLVNLKIN